MKEREIIEALLVVLESATFAGKCCNNADDRMYHAADKTWWKRVGNSWVSAEPPECCKERN